MSAYDSTRMIRDDRDLRDIVKEIGSQSRCIDDVRLPDKPAIYGIFADESGCLSAIDCKDSDLLYVGKSNELKRRGHFKIGSTCRSTLRRTFGALLKQELGLNAYARDRRHDRRSAVHFCFDGGGEERLTEWMKANLRIGFSIVVDDIAEIEKRLIRYCEPVLNLTDWPNPQAEKIKASRRICIDEALRNGPLEDHRS